MKAIVKHANEVRLEEIPQPDLKLPGQVIVKVLCAGICKTDILMAQGQTESDQNNLILGHEFAGVVSEVGENCHLKPGDTVCVMPILPCRECDRCLAQDEVNCYQQRMLGVDLDGGFAEFVCVPKSCVYKLPNTDDIKKYVFFEPIVAGLSVLKANLHQDKSGVVIGDNRIASLIKKILEIKGFQNITVLSNHNDKQKDFDFAIDTVVTSQSLDLGLNVLRHQGTLVVKGRVAESIDIDLSLMRKKELQVEAVNYGSTQDALNLLADKSFSLADLYGTAYSLNDFQKAFESGDDSKKTFLIP